MLKFSIEKKAIAPHAGLLANVAGLKSPGAPVIEQCGLMLTGSLLTITAINEANAIVIEDIPIVVEEGNPADFADRTTRVNVKKLVSIIKTAKDTIHFLMEDNRLTIKTGKTTYTLEAYRSDRSAMPALRMASKQVPLKMLTQIFRKAHMLTQNTEVVTVLSGCLISGNELFCTDRVSAIYMKKTGLADVMPESIKGDILIAPDLFATCLPKFDEEAGSIGITESGNRLIIKVGNTYLGKTLMSGTYDKEKILKVYKTILAVGSDNGVFATINLSEFVEKMKEYQGIMELDRHMVVLSREGTLRIFSKNSKVGVGASEVMIEAANLKMPPQVGDVYGGELMAKAILNAGDIFGEEEKPEFDITMNIVTVNKILCPSVFSIDTPTMLYFTVPRSVKSAQHN
jgi:hypothetical protein